MPSKTLELDVSSLAHDGRGIAFLRPNNTKRGKVIFIAGALPGQKILCTLGKDHGTWQEGQLSHILDAGECSCPPLCPHSQECGGCSLQAMPYALQLKWKTQILIEAMSRIGGLGSQSLKAAWKGLETSSQISAYRNKIELAFGYDPSGQIFLGMRKRASHEIIPLRRCALVDEAANALIQRFQFLVQNWEWPKNFWRFLVLRKDQDFPKARWRLLAISAPASKKETAQSRQLAAQLLKDSPELYAYIHEIRKQPSQIAKGEKRLFCLGRDNNNNPDLATLSFSLGGRLFKADVSSFFQVNSYASEKLAQLALKGASLCESKDSLLDLYCGVGAPGLLLAPNFKRYLGLELDPLAIAEARRNAGDLAHCAFKAGDSEKVLATPPRDFADSVSTILVDPPRAGLGKNTMQSLLKLQPHNIIMISCNPATLARDARIISQAYELEILGAVDLFPQTTHVESCCVWRKK